MNELRSPVEWPVEMSAVELGEFLTRLVSETESENWSPGIGRTHTMWATRTGGRRYWLYRTEKNGRFTLVLQTPGTKEEIPPVYPLLMVDRETGKSFLPEDRTPEPLFGTPAKGRRCAEAMRIDLQPMGVAHTRLRATWCQPWGRIRALDLLREIGKYRPEVREQLARKGLDEAGQVVEAPKGESASSGKRLRGVPGPRKAAQYRNWKYIWELIKPLVVRGQSNRQIHDWLVKMRRGEITCSYDRLGHIIRAGTAGSLELPNPPSQ